MAVDLYMWIRQEGSKGSGTVSEALDKLLDKLRSIKFILFILILSIYDSSFNYVRL